VQCLHHGVLHSILATSIDSAYQVGGAISARGESAPLGSIGLQTSREDVSETSYKCGLDRSAN
jgi:hypothetical protein